MRRNLVAGPSRCIFSVGFRAGGRRRKRDEKEERRGEESWHEFLSVQRSGFCTSSKRGFLGSATENWVDRLFNPSWKMEPSSSMSHVCIFPISLFDRNTVTSNLYPINHQLNGTIGVSDGTITNMYCNAVCYLIFIPFIWVRHEITPNIFNKGSRKVLTSLVVSLIFLQYQNQRQQSFSPFICKK